MGQVGTVKSHRRRMTRSFCSEIGKECKTPSGPVCKDRFGSECDEAKADEASVKWGVVQVEVTTTRRMQNWVGFL